MVDLHVGILHIFWHGFEELFKQWQHDEVGGSGCAAGKQQLPVLYTKEGRMGMMDVLPYM